MGKVHVSKIYFCEQIKLAFDDINFNYHLSISREERVQWFVRALKNFKKLSFLKCHDPLGEEGRMHKEICELFEVHCNENFGVWIDALYQVGEITEDQHTASLFVGRLVETESANKEVRAKIDDLNAKILEVIEITKKIENLQKTNNELRVAIDYYTGNASDFTKRRWNQMLLSNEDTLEKTLIIADALRLEVDSIIR